MILVGRRYPCGGFDGAAPVLVDIEAECRTGHDGRPWLFLLNGPTGYESMPLEEWSGRDWCACAGCNNYARLVIPAAEMRRAQTFFLAAAR